MIAENPAPQIHDTALMVATWSVEGSAMLSVSDHVQIGVRGEWHSYDWATPSAEGTMPLPSAPSGWGVGPEMRLAFPLDEEKRFALGIAVNVMQYQVPYAEWKLGTCAASPSCFVTSEGSTYQLFDEKSESHLTYSLGLYPSFGIGEGNKYGHVFALVDATNGFANDGFTDTPTNGSSIRVTGPVWIVGAGYGATFDAFHLAAMGYLPLDGQGSPIAYGPGLQVTLGVALDLWSRDERD